MLEIRGLSVEVAGRVVLKDIDLSIMPGETHVLLGPNGSGKTSLIMTIMGFSRYKVVSGSIRFKGTDLLGLSVDERARLGIGLAFQRPPVIRGVTLRQMAEIALGRREDGKRVRELADQLNCQDLLDRDVNHGFSGGEMKRAELLQLLAQRPDLALIDEPESGVDLDNIAVVGSAINDLLGKQRVRGRQASGLIITHTANILEYVNADVGLVLIDGNIVCKGNPRDIFHEVRRNGYRRCFTCDLA